METKGTLIVYPDVCWSTPKTFNDLEKAGFIYKFSDFIDDGNVDSVLAIIDQVRIISNTFDYWDARFIPDDA